jgi:hypothetical protein
MVLSETYLLTLFLITRLRSGFTKTFPWSREM